MAQRLGITALQNITNEVLPILQAKLPNEYELGAGLNAEYTVPRLSNSLAFIH